MSTPNPGDVLPLWNPDIPGEEIQAGRLGIRVRPGTPAAAKVLNPDISVIGDFLGAAGNGANRGAPAINLAKHFHKYVMGKFGPASHQMSGL